MASLTVRRPSAMASRSGSGPPAADASAVSATTRATARLVASSRMRARWPASGAMVRASAARSHRGNQAAGAVTDGDHRGDLAMGEHGGGVAGYLAGDRGVRRIRQVVAKPQLDPLPGAASTDHHQAAGRMEAEQVGDDREDVSGRSEPDRGYAGLAGCTGRVRGGVVRG
jgi:hypothetical protein